MFATYIDTFSYAVTSFIHLSLRQKESMHKKFWQDVYNCVEV
jgi:hypothetical protein